jgi:hypothetical protein
LKKEGREKRDSAEAEEMDTKATPRTRSDLDKFVPPGEMSRIKAAAIA